MGKGDRIGETDRGDGHKMEQAGTALMSNSIVIYQFRQNFGVQKSLKSFQSIDSPHFENYLF